MPQVEHDDLLRWVVCARFPHTPYRHGVIVVGTAPQRGTMLRAGVILLRNWAREKHLDQGDATFLIHLESEREQCRVCVPKR